MAVRRKVSRLARASVPVAALALGWSAGCSSTQITPSDPTTATAPGGTGSSLAPATSRAGANTGTVPGSRPGTTEPATTSSSSTSSSTTSTPDLTTSTVPVVTTAPSLTPGAPCTPGSSPDCIDPDGDGAYTYLIGGADCLANLPPGLCEDLDGDGRAGYPDSG